MMTKPTVAEHVSREDKSYQSADRQAMLVHFADIRRKIQAMDSKINFLQRDVAHLKAQQSALSTELATPVKPPVIAAMQSHKAPSPHKQITETLPARKPAGKVAPVAMPAVKTAVPVTTTPTPAPVIGGPLRVVGVRLGDDSHHTRLVFDTSGAANLTADVDNQEKLLVITLPKTGWDAARSNTFPQDKRLEGYQVMSGTGPDTQVVFSLRQNVTLGAPVALPPGGTRGHRIYIDLK